MVNHYSFDINTELNTYKYIVTEFGKKSPYQPTNEAITKYQQDITSEANKYNDDGKFIFDNLNILTSLKTSNDITINDLQWDYLTFLHRKLRWT